MRILYLLNRVQKGSIGHVLHGNANDDHLYGMLRLREFSGPDGKKIETDYAEIERSWPAWLARIVRDKILNVYWVHAPLFFSFLRYDVVFTSTAFGSQFIWALWPFKKPKWVMLDFSITGFLGKEKTRKQKFFRFLVKRADGIVTISEKEKELLEKRFPEKKGSIEFVRFGVDTEFFKPKEGHEEKDMIFCPGRDPGRDFRTLFDAARGLNHDVVVTTRPWTLKKLGVLPHYVKHKDLNSREFMEEFISAKVVVIPLNLGGGANDAMGCSSLVEAMAMGKAVIATRTPTTESYITDGENGLLVPSHDVEALRDAMERLMHDKGLREKLGKKAREFAVKECSSKAWAGHLAAYFSHIMASKMSPKGQK